MSDSFRNLTDLGGLYTDAPEDKIPNRNATDIAEMDLSIRGLIQTRKGYSLFANKITEVGKITRMYLYRKNFGTVSKIMLRVRDNETKSVLEWYNASNPDTSEGAWELLVDSLTTGAIMGFAPFNNTNVNQLIFCNAVQNYSSWNGSTALVSSVTATTITKSGTATFAFEGFSATGVVMVDGVAYTYTGIDVTGKILQGVTPNPVTGGVQAGDGIAQQPDTTTYSSLPKGNIFVVAGARVWVSGVTNRESTLYYSAVGDATNFTAGTNPDDAGIEDFPDGGGKITFLDSKDNSKIIIHKEDAILQFVLDYTSTAKIPKLDVISFADDVGATNIKAGTGRSQISYFVSGTEGLKSLARALDGSDINLGEVSDIILPTIKDYDNSDAAAIYLPTKRCIMVATNDGTSSYNNKVISYYLKRTADGTIAFDISIDDIFVSDWLLNEKELYYGSSTEQNVFKMFEQNSANGVGINHKWTSKEFTFDEPARGKEFNKLYIEGFIGERTKIKVTVLYGLLGSGGAKSKTLSWDDDYVSPQKISALGTEVLGTVSLGASSVDISDSYSFSVPIHFDVNKSTRYKIKIETFYDDETDIESYWAISNIATNPDLKVIENNKIINSNV